MPPLEGNEQVKLKPEETIAEIIKLNPRKRRITGTGLKILTPNKLLTRLLILLAQIKFGKSSNKLKTKPEKYYIYFTYLQFNQVIMLMEENMILIGDPKTFYF